MRMDLRGTLRSFQSTGEPTTRRMPGFQAEPRPHGPPGDQSPLCPTACRKAALRTRTVASNSNSTEAPDMIALWVAQPTKRMDPAIVIASVAFAISTYGFT